MKSYKLLIRPNIGRQAHQYTAISSVQAPPPSHLQAANMRCQPAPERPGRHQAAGRVSAHYPALVTASVLRKFAMAYWSALRLRVREPVDRKTLQTVDGWRPLGARGTEMQPASNPGGGLCWQRWPYFSGQDSPWNQAERMA